MYISKEIVEEIFLRLPVKSLLRFRCVRKSWYKFLKHNTDFVQKHLKHSIEKNSSKLLCTGRAGVSSIDFDHHSSPNKIIQNHMDYPFKSLHEDIKLSGSCNGVLFIKVGGKDLVTGLWNPATQEYKVIPLPISPSGIQWGNRNYPPRNYGFGYDRLSDEYKLVAILSPLETELMVSEVQVYTLSSNSWKQTEYIPYKIGSTGVFVHEALHWLASPCPVRSNNTLVLLAFNMAKEVFNELEILDDIHKFEYIRIDVLEGFLCMLCSNTCDIGFEVWVMKDYGGGDSWTKRYNISLWSFGYAIPSFRCLRRIHSLKNGVILLETHLTDTHSALVFYDPKHERAWVEDIELRNYGRWPTKVSTARLTSKLYTEIYVESLVSLHSGTYVEGEQEKSDFDDAYGIFQCFSDW